VNEEKTLEEIIQEAVVLKFLIRQTEAQTTTANEELILEMLEKLIDLRDALLTISKMEHYNELTEDESMFVTRKIALDALNGIKCEESNRPKIKLPEDNPAKVVSWHFHWKFWKPKIRNLIGDPVRFGWYAYLDDGTLQTREQVFIKRDMGIIEK